MHTPASVSLPLPIPEPLALADATLVFLVQVLIAQNPDLLDVEDKDVDSHAPPLLHASRHILGAIRELHYALDTYRAILPDKPGFLAGDVNDDFPF